MVTDKIMHYGRFVILLSKQLHKAKRSERTLHTSIGQGADTSRDSRAKLRVW